MNKLFVLFALIPSLISLNGSEISLLNHSKTSRFIIQKKQICDNLKRNFNYLYLLETRKHINDYDLSKDQETKFIKNINSHLLQTIDYFMNHNKSYYALNLISRSQQDYPQLVNTIDLINKLSSKLIEILQEISVDFNQETLATVSTQFIKKFK